MVNYALSIASRQRIGWGLENSTRLFGGLAHVSLNGVGGRTTGRGPVTFTLDDEYRLVRWRIGDTAVTSVSGEYGRAAIGVSFESEFGIDPGFTTYAPIGLDGATAVPAVAEVYVNGRLLSRTPVAPGSFTLDDVPAPVGAGDVRVVVRDQFGRERSIARDYYRSPLLLRAGLQAYRYAVGVPRLRANGATWTYGGLAGAADHRMGLTDRVTVGLTGAFDGNAWSAGGNMAADSRFGEIELDVRTSRADGRAGGALFMTYARRGGRVSGSATFHTRSAAFLALERVAARANRHTNVLVALDVILGRGISVGARYTLDEAGLTASLPLPGGLSVQTSASRRTENGGGWTGLAVLTVPISARSSATLSQERRTDSSVASHVSLQRALAMGPGVGYRMDWQSAGAVPMTGGAIYYQGSSLRAEARTDHIAGRSVTTGTVSGAVVAVDRTVRLSAPVGDAFALVRVADTPGVRAYLSNQFVGRTDRNGDLVIPSLSSYNANQVDVDDRDLPVTMALASASAVVAPAPGGGVVVRFRIDDAADSASLGERPVSTVRAIGELRDEDGALPLGGADIRATWPGGEERTASRSDGRIELTRAPIGSHVLLASTAAGRFECAMEIRANAIEADGSQHVGVVPCRRVAATAARVGSAP